MHPFHSSYHFFGSKTRRASLPARKPLKVGVRDTAPDQVAKRALYGFQVRLSDVMSPFL